MLLRTILHNTYCVTAMLCRLTCPHAIALCYTTSTSNQRLSSPVSCCPYALLLPHTTASRVLLVRMYALLALLTLFTCVAATASLRSRY